MLSNCLPLTFLRYSEVESISPVNRYDKNASEANCYAKHWKTKCNLFGKTLHYWFVNYFQHSSSKLFNSLRFLGLFGKPDRSQYCKTPCICITDIFFVFLQNGTCVNKKYGKTEEIQKYGENTKIRRKIRKYGEKSRNTEIQNKEFYSIGYYSSKFKFKNFWFWTFLQNS